VASAVADAAGAASKAADAKVPVATVPAAAGAPAAPPVAAAPAAPAAPAPAASAGKSKRKSAGGGKNRRSWTRPKSCVCSITSTNPIRRPEKPSFADAERTFGCDRTLLGRWQKRKAEIEKMPQSAKRQKGGGRKPASAAVDAATAKWVH